MIDTHAHMYFHNYQDDLEEVLQRAWEVGVRQIILPGTSITDSKQALELASSYQGPIKLSAAAGVHPSDIDQIEKEDIKELEQLVSRQDCVAVGEVGLDFFKYDKDRELQQERLRWMVELAAKYQKPLIIHNREAGTKTLEILEEYKSQKITGVFHCFSEDINYAERVFELGFYIALGGVVTFKNAQKTHQVALEAPLERMVIETDAPFLCPHPYRGQRNEPARIIEVVRKIAEIREIDQEEVIQETTKNAIELFNLGSNNQGGDHHEG